MKKQTSPRVPNFQAKKRKSRVVFTLQHLGLALSLYLAASSGLGFESLPCSIIWAWL